MTTTTAYTAAAVRRVAKFGDLFGDLLRREFLFHYQAIDDWATNLPLLTGAVMGLSRLYADNDVRAVANLVEPIPELHRAADLCARGAKVAARQNFENWRYRLDRDVVRAQSGTHCLEPLSDTELDNALVTLGKVQSSVLRATAGLTTCEEVSPTSHAILDADLPLGPGWRSDAVLEQAMMGLLQGLHETSAEALYFKARRLLLAWSYMTTVAPSHINPQLQEKVIDLCSQARVRMQTLASDSERWLRVHFKESLAGFCERLEACNQDQGISPDRFPQEKMTLTNLACQLISRNFARVPLVADGTIIESELGSV